ncbi:hypothetical protein CWATWH8502_3819 [Crocosphaera watsonii WH 8502]|uniref:Uncharacterized protein n=2 Tax=Crocosphaera watsonii TaxID=263511 RepID=T2JLH9_CROWT|nr:hypothetical protein [Crocosphaera watsonii]NQZ60957.1 hypothetical protein [Crocosphaera sp.]CCQ48784.1 hypothetical protein CWATWH8502_3819 [Crocosphaera watsonii WH 8502]CCQ65931.1 hypothetical protein CWATWH0402_953 [Crocosphaera watsonii WH 0402]
MASGAKLGIKGKPKSDDITLRFGLSKPRMEAGLKGNNHCETAHEIPKLIGHG